MGGLGMGGPDMGDLILYGACNGGPGIVRNVPNPARTGTRQLRIYEEFLKVTTKLPIS